MESQKNRGVRSQTLERALDALTVLADGRRRTSQELADDLGLHRSIVYRILRTLEDYTFVRRADDGRYTLGIGLSALAGAGIAVSDLRVEDALSALAVRSVATAIFCVPQKDQAVVIASTQPESRAAAVAIRRGTRFPLDAGAPGYAILSLGAAREYEADETTLARSTGIVHTKGSPFPGFEVVSHPVPLGDGQPASISVVFPLGAHDLNEVLPPLRQAAADITGPADLWTV